MNEGQLVQLQLTFDRMQDNLKFAMERLNELTITAPIDGQLTSFNAEIGQSIGRGTRIGIIDALDGGYRSEVEVDEYYLPRVKVAQKASFTLAGKEYNLEITWVYPEVVSNHFVVNMDFVGDIPPDIRTGQTIHPKLQLSRLTEAVLVPKGGFNSKSGGNWIFVVDRSTGSAVKRKIKTGKMNNSHYEITEGLEPGELVITSTYDNYDEIDKLVFTGDLSLLDKIK